MKRLAIFAAVLALALPFHGAKAQNLGTIRIGETDNGALDLVQLIAYKRAEARGVKIEITAMKSKDLIFQAVLDGQLDMGIGDSYAQIKNLKVPIRNIYRIRKFAYPAVVDKTVYPTWASLNGHTFVVHSRGSSTDTMAKIVEKEKGIKFSSLMYLPGTAVRYLAMQRGQIKATFLDLVTSRLLVEKDPKRFAILPAIEANVGDSTLYANEPFVAAHRKAVQVLLEELLKAARATAKDPAWPAAQRKELGLLPDLNAEQVANITPYFKDAEATGVFPTDGGSEAAAKADIRFEAAAGVFDENKLPPLSDYWDFAPLEGALAFVH
jgi:ABC-type nitrate/sulfonate/bicarbonate transport system substrate-binding protein